jgi:NADH-quinone oxidoreductase subunit B
MFMSSGCPPRPEALIGAFIELQKKIDKESLLGEQLFSGKA